MLLLEIITMGASPQPPNLDHNDYILITFVSSMICFTGVIMLVYVFYMRVKEWWNKSRMECFMGDTIKVQDIVGYLFGATMFAVWAIVLTTVVRLFLIPAYGPEPTYSLFTSPMFSWILFGPAPLFIFIGHFIVLVAFARNSEKKRRFDLKVIKGMALGFCLWLFALTAISYARINIPYGTSDIIGYLLMGAVFLLSDRASITGNHHG